MGGRKGRKDSTRGSASLAAVSGPRGSVGMGGSRPPFASPGPVLRPLTVEELRLDTEELLLSMRSSEGQRPGVSSPFCRVSDAACCWGDGEEMGAPAFPQPWAGVLARPLRNPRRLLSTAAAAPAYLGCRGCWLPGAPLGRRLLRLGRADLIAPGSGGWGGAQVDKRTPREPGPETVFRVRSTAPGTTSTHRPPGSPSFPHPHLGGR